MQTIRQRIKEAQDRQKSYADAHRVDRSYEVSDQVFLQVKSHKISIKFGKGPKIFPRFVGPFKIVERNWPWPINLPCLILEVYARCFSCICFETLY